jgi:hypothetical protein
MPISYLALFERAGTSARPELGPPSGIGAHSSRGKGGLPCAPAWERQFGVKQPSCRSRLKG